jgi:hypothetical protein
MRQAVVEENPGLAAPSRGPSRSVPAADLRRSSRWRLELPEPPRIHLSIMGESAPSSARSPAMSPPTDPYAAPSTRLDIKTAGKLRVDGSSLVMPTSYTLPEICVISGTPQPAPESRKTVTLNFVPRMHLWFFGLFAYLFSRRTATITYSIEPAIGRARARRWRIAFGTLFFGIAAFWGGVAFDLIGVTLFGGLAIFASLLMIAFWCRLLWTTEIEGNRVTVRGISGAAIRAIMEREAETEKDADGNDWRTAAFLPRKDRAESTTAAS